MIPWFPYKVWIMVIKGWILVTPLKHRYMACVPYPKARRPSFILILICIWWYLNVRLQITWFMILRHLWSMGRIYDRKCMYYGFDGIDFWHKPHLSWIQTPIMTLVLSLSSTFKALVCSLCRGHSPVEHLYSVQRRSSHHLIPNKSWYYQRSKAFDRHLCYHSKRRCFRSCQTRRSITCTRAWLTLLVTWCCSAFVLSAHNLVFCLWPSGGTYFVCGCAFVIGLWWLLSWGWNPMRWPC